MTSPSSIVDLQVSVTGNLNAKRILFFINGFGTNKEIWQDVISSFENEFQIVRYNYVGSTKETHSIFTFDKYPDLKSHVDDAALIFEALNLKNVIIIAHSMGGYLATKLSILLPERIDKIVFLASSARYLNDTNYFGGFETNDVDQTLNMMQNDYVSWAGNLSVLAMKNPAKASLANHFFQSLSGFQPAVAIHFMRLILAIDYREILPKIDKECLIVQTYDDIFVPLDAAIYLSKNIKNSNLSLIEATGHFPQLSAPELLNKEIHFFVDSNS